MIIQKFLKGVGGVGWGLGWGWGGGVGGGLGRFFVLHLFGKRWFCGGGGGGGDNISVLTYHGC